MKPKPHSLFSGMLLRHLMNETLNKIRLEISYLSYEGLTGTSHDDLVQSLYNEHQLELPYLKRAFITQKLKLKVNEAKSAAVDPDDIVTCPKCANSQHET